MRGTGLRSGSVGDAQQFLNSHERTGRVLVCVWVAVADNELTEWADRVERIAARVRCEEERSRNMRGARTSQCAGLSLKGMGLARWLFFRCPFLGR